MKSNTLYDSHRTNCPRNKTSKLAKKFKFNRKLIFWTKESTKQYVESCVYRVFLTFTTKTRLIIVISFRFFNCLGLYFFWHLPSRIIGRMWILNLFYQIRVYVKKIRLNTTERLSFARYHFAMCIKYPFVHLPS